MILFYAWTDIQLMNCVNTKCNIYAETEADLLVFGLSRVSGDLVEIITNTGVFRNVFCIELPEFYLERRRAGVREKLEAICAGPKLRRNIYAQLKTTIGSTPYTELLTGAFWGETLIVYRYMKQHHAAVSIYLVEEGLACYNAPKNWLFQPSPNQSVAAKIRGLLYYGLLPHTARRYVKGIYLYAPQLSNLTINMIRLPVIHQENEICYHIFEEWSKNCSLLEQKDIIYVADGPRTNSAEPYAGLQYMMKLMRESVPQENLYVKMHPIAADMPMDSTHTALENCCADYRRIPLELLFFHEAMEDKIVVVNNSSSIFYLTNTLGKCPYIIFVNQLCKINGQQGESRIQVLVDKFIEMYENKEKVACPKDDEEFVQIIQSFVKQITIKSKE